VIYRHTCHSEALPKNLKRRCCGKNMCRTPSLALRHCVPSVRQGWRHWDWLWLWDPSTRRKAAAQDDTRHPLRMTSVTRLRMTRGKEIWTKQLTKTYYGVTIKLQKQQGRYPQTVSTLKNH
jgi:hypothetical protein